MLRKLGIVNTIILLTAIICSSCTQTIYQDHEVIRHDSIYITAISVDTLIQRDSVHTIERGDTVLQTVYKYIYKVHERTDTAYIDRTDTVTLTDIETKVVTKTNWKTCIWTFVIGLLLPIVIVVARRFHRQ